MNSERAGYIDQAHPPVAPPPLWSREHTPSRARLSQALEHVVPVCASAVRLSAWEGYPPYACEGSLFALSRASGRGNCLQYASALWCAVRLFVAGSVRPGFVTPSNVTDRPRNASPRAPCASVGRVEPVHRVLSSRAGCARPRALWRAILHTARPFYCVRKFLAPLPICPAYRAFSLCFDVSFCWCRVSTGATC